MAAIEPVLGRFGRYVLVRELGRGGMGVVYSAFDPSLDRKVALKVLRRGEGSNQGAAVRGRLVREAKAMARLSHPNVVHVYEVGTFEGDEVFIAMELIEGEPCVPGRRRSGAGGRISCARIGRPATAWRPRARPASSIATSSPTTSWSEMTVAFACSTLASLFPRPMPAARR